jgi:chorismate mutase
MAGSISKTAGAMWSRVAGGTPSETGVQFGLPDGRAAGADGAGGTQSNGGPSDGKVIDLERRRDQLNARVAELQWDLGGLVYEMAIRDRIRVDVIVKRAAELQDADAKRAEVERILRMEATATAGACSSCGAPHSSGAAFCWQCGQPLLRQVDTSSIFAP